MLACKSRNIDLQRRIPLELVGIEFYADEEPGGSALLLFSHGGALRLDVECLECELTDLGPDDLGTGDDAVSSGLEGERRSVGDAKRRAVSTILAGSG